MRFTRIPSSFPRRREKGAINHHTTITMNILIVKLREVNGMTVAQIASYLKVSPAYVRAVIRGSI